MKSFLKQIIKTQNFSLGNPRNITFSAGSKEIFFLRSKAGDDSINCLWKLNLDQDSFSEKLLVDPGTVFNESSEQLPLAERQRRERARESADGIVSITTDNNGDQVGFVLGGDLYIYHEKKGIQCLVSGQGVFDPHLSPDGKLVAYVADGALHTLTTAAAHEHTLLAKGKAPYVTWGQADFIAAEEMDRLSGYWWSPDSTHVLACRVDNRRVRDCYIADASKPEEEPAGTKYPYAGTENSEVKLAVINAKTQSLVWVKWKAREFPYLVDVDWSRAKPFIVVQARDQKTVQMLTVDIKTGKTEPIHTKTDPNWVELVPGFPAQLADGTIIDTADGECRDLVIGSQTVSSDLNVRSMCGILHNGTIVFSAWQKDPKSPQIWAVHPNNRPRQVTKKPGTYNAIAAGSLCVISRRTVEDAVPVVTVYRVNSDNWSKVGSIQSKSEQPFVKARPIFYHGKSRPIETAVIFPTDYDGTRKLPVLVDSYGGPHAQRVVSAQAAYANSQWFADQGFAVMIIDGRGTPGHGPAWEKAVAGNLIDPILDDQVEALKNLATDDRFDFTKVGIRGWSFGGYLAAFAVIKYPDIFHAAIAGAPVTDWRLYDTHYSERYLGDPNTNPKAYDHCSLIKAANTLRRPLLLVHGLADDNVLFAHTMQFSSALLAAAKPHQILPLAAMTHMANHVQVAESLARLELKFLQDHLLDSVIRS